MTQRPQPQPGDYSVLEGHLGYRFRDGSLLQRALTHKSFVNENAGGSQHNERLEFLGDAVIGLAVAHLVMESFPDKTEGELSLLRSRVVNEQSLANLAGRIDLGQWLFLGRGEENTGGRYKPSLLADAYEAVIGALYTDGGFSEALAFCKRQVGPLVAELARSGSQDHKSRLQEFVQGRLRTRPRYELLSEEGPGHDKTFEVAVWLEDRLVAQARGKSKREAEQRAAELALLSVLTEPAAPETPDPPGPPDPPDPPELG